MNEEQQREPEEVVNASSNTEKSKTVLTSPGKDASKTVNIAVSSRALFDLDDEHKIFEEQGLQAYLKVQNERVNVIPKKGPAFPFIKILESINAKLREKNPDEEEIFGITLMSRNDAEAGIRLSKAIDYYKDEGLNVSRMALTSGTSIVKYLKAFEIMLLLTSYEDEVSKALQEDTAAAVMKRQPIKEPDDAQLRIVFDMDAVLFSDESEKIYQEKGLDAFTDNEETKKDIPLSKGPLKPFAEAIGRMQKKLSEHVPCPIRTYIVTSRDAKVATRALNTLKEWGLKIDESFYMSGAPKDKILEVINSHIFFDDQETHVKKATKKGTPSGHVNYGPEYDSNKKEVVKKKLFEQPN